VGAAPEPWTKGADVVVAAGTNAPFVFAAVAPSAPVQMAPCGQHATARFWSAVHVAERGQHRPGALSAAQA
jgi:hypothetical protein